MRKVSPSLLRQRVSPYIPLVLIFIIGVSGRLITLDLHDLFVDEAWSWVVTQLPIRDIIRLSEFDPHPPFYYLVLKTSLLLFPATEWGLRMVSVLCSCASLALILIYVTRWWSKEAAWYAGIMTILSSLEFYYAQNARMYALLSFLVLTSYILLVEALRNKPYLYILWGTINVLMIWTHFYGFMMVGTQILFLFGFLTWHKATKKHIPINLVIWSIVGTALTVLGSVPMLQLLLHHVNGHIGGSWYPGIKEPLRFFSFFTVGLPSLSLQIPYGGKNLLLPFLQAVPTVVWWISGSLVALVLLPGIIAIWKSRNTEQGIALIPGILLIFVPATFAFMYGRITHAPVWSDKPFLGVGYIFSIWASIGLMHIPYVFVRRGIVIILLTFSLAALVPYIVSYKQTDVVDALNTLPDTVWEDEQQALIANYSWFSSLLLYYRKSDKPIWGLDANGIVEIKSEQYPLPHSVQVLSSDDPSLVQITDVWIYEGFQSQQHYPAYLLTKNIWIFRTGKWMRYKPE